MKQGKGYDGMTCAKCEIMAERKSGHQALCAKHYRLQQMKVNARRHKKIVPTSDALLRMVENLGSDLICPACERPMNWLSVNGQQTVITLQHDRDGGLRLLCRSCNTRHAAYPGDTFYELPDNHKLCPRCNQILPLEQFCKDAANWTERKTYCRGCSTKYHKESVEKNKETYNAKRRAYYYKRKNSGNPIPRRSAGLLRRAGAGWQFG